MRVMVAGAAGRLGRTVVEEFRRAGDIVVALGRADLDVTRPADVARAVFASRPDVIINCSAYNNVDAAETDQETAFAINATGPAILADVARRSGVALVHYSSDFVFDGLATVPYRETDRTHPCNVYGASKLAGERHTVRAPVHYVLRLASVFGGSEEGRSTSIDWIIDGIWSGRTVPAFVDRVVSPSYAPDVALATRLLLESHAPVGIYHCVNTGYCTWYELAQQIASDLAVSPSLQRTSVFDRPQKAARPQFCALSSAKLAARGIVMPHWQNAIARHVRMRRPAPTILSIGSLASVRVG